MPYIKQKAREKFDTTPLPKGPGELNYVITKAINDYYWMANVQNYQTINDIIGALEGAKLEFYRRVAAPYEDEKIKENGDVY